MLHLRTTCAARLWLFLAIAQSPVGAASALAEWPATEAKPLSHVVNNSKATRSAAAVTEIESTIRRCLRNADLGKRELEVRLLLLLDRNGMLQEIPKVVFSKEVSDPGLIVAALSGCQPYQLPPESYETWKQLDLTYSTEPLVR